MAIKIRQFMPDALLARLKEMETRSQVRRWEKAGKPLPPPHGVKRMRIRNVQGTTDATTLVETGTYTGEMVFVQLRKFKEIHSIELSDYYYDRAVKRFRKYPHVHLHHGDSALMLHDVLKQLSSPAIFWLDGHYSGGMTAKGEKECPIFGELEAVLQSPYEHTILIDDADAFVGANDYPTIEELKQYLNNTGRKYFCSIDDNIICIDLNRMP
jgi:hypothetical protein